MIDGDGSGDDRRLTALMKMYIKYCKLKSPDQLDFVFLIKSCEVNQSVKKIIFVFNQFIFIIQSSIANLHTC